MNNRFKSKRKINISISKIIILFLLIYISFKAIIFLYKHIIKPINHTVILQSILPNYDHYTNNSIISAINYASNTFINNPANIINKSISIQWNYTNNQQQIDDTTNKLEAETIQQPLVYIYNSHQGESYNNSDNTVLTAAHNLQQELLKYNINSLVEEQNIEEFMRINNMKYQQSYEASRYYIIDAIENNPSIKLFIDLHRDSSTHDTYSTIINDKSYAKIMFVIGKDNSNYQNNYQTATAINNLIIKNYPSLSKGILEKQGFGVNGVYNQDLNPNIILLELGCNENDITEVNNTITILSKVIGEYLNGQI